APGGQFMTNYARMYRFGITPWERYRTVAAASMTALLDREQTGRSRPLGRALDLGCGRGQYTPELARRGWEAVGIDYVPAAIEAAAAKAGGGRAQLRRWRRDAAAVGPPVDVRLLPRHRLLPGFGRRTACLTGGGVSALANPGATLLLLSFGPSRWR